MDEAKERGTPVGWLPEREQDHFMKCPACNRWFDMRDWTSAFAHDGPLPHPGDSEQ